MEPNQDAPHWLDADLARSLAERFGTPLYVYHEGTLRRCLRELAGLLAHRPFRPSISVKANGNPWLLAIARKEGLHGDAMSPGEILLLETARFSAEDIVFVPNNVGAEEFHFAAARGILTSLDSLDQLRLFAEHVPGAKVSLRIDPGIGDGHHQKVVTAGAGGKFGILPDEIPQALAIAAKADVKVVGLNQHIGSGFLDPTRFLAAADLLLGAARGVPDVEFVDFGGGFGIPYRGEGRLDLERLGQGLDERLARWEDEMGKRLEARLEPGRYWCAEGGALLGTVHAVKRRERGVLAGCDLGFNVLQRPCLYDAWHGIDLLAGTSGKRTTESVTWVGNVCESGDVLGKARLGSCPARGDLVRVRDAGAYGWSMSSSYNARPRAAEVLLCSDSSIALIRSRESLEDLLRQVPSLPIEKGLPCS